MARAGAAAASSLVLSCGGRDAGRFETQVRVHAGASTMTLWRWFSRPGLTAGVRNPISR